MKTSETIKSIGVSLSIFHSEVGTIKKDATNPFFKSNYASLSNILDAISKPLHKAGLIFTQFPDGEDGLTTILIHPESGEYLQATYAMRPVKNDPQALGSAITYARRYALGAILGLNIEEDDDGNAATPQPTQQAATTTQGNDDKTWLNKNTPEYTAVVTGLQNKTITMQNVWEKYKVSKAMKAELGSLIG